MRRRDFVRSAGAGGALVGAAAVASTFPTPAIAQGIKQFKMVTTWPKNYPGLGTGAERLAQRITEMSEGQIEVQAYAAGELVGGLFYFNYPGGTGLMNGAVFGRIAGTSAGQRAAQRP